ncbi:site-specific integrase [Listeria monocytogenes]|uniref:site-specific integrase n=1 Tax=Listeria monocytogenes TaxID=1639 RepID=UPI000E73130F|nr:site-specific integrase [Listeria monocytogenes]EAC5149939.1 site-specific integrase [Listeria monocytogenes]EAD6813475.1 site-specific integrase [Listeria monocytogenes]EAE1620024.1 site-specific integrase [Listeria monocytogenes]EAE3792200.1 site-specific integrase [Listeria monocytogenes]EAE6187428.1 site-specific integrase [Listeria monocytogenes]
MAKKSRLVGTIEQRGPSSWRMRVTVGYDEAGNPVREQRNTRTKRAEDREKELSAFITELESGDYVDTKSIIFRDFTKEFMAKQVEKELQITTQELYSSIIEFHILPYFGHKKIDEISTMQVINFLDKMEKSGSSAHVRRNVLSTLRSIFTRAVKWRVIKNNPCDGVSPPKRPKKVQKVFDEAGIALLFEKLKNEPLKWRVLVSIAVMTGAREGEVAGLEWKHVDLDKQTILFEQTIVEKKGVGVVVRPGIKNGEFKLLSIPNSLTSLLVEYKKVREKEKEAAQDEWTWPDHFFLFTNVNGKPIRTDSIYQRWVKFLEKNGLERIRFHDIRHTSASLLIARGVHAKIIQERLGHADIGTTMNIYSHVFREADQSATSHFDNLL